MPSLDLDQEMIYILNRLFIKMAKKIKKYLRNIFNSIDKNIARLVLIFYRYICNLKYFFSKKGSKQAISHAMILRNQGV